MGHKEEQKTRMENILRRLSAEFIQRESSRASLITVTRADYKDRLNKATIFVTILPESSEKSGIDFLKRQRGEFRDYVKKHSRLKRLPFFDFDIDTGEKNRVRADELLRGTRA